MATPFRLKRSAVSGKRPGLSDLQKGELALNFYDGHLYATRDTAGVGIGTTVSNLTPWKENFNNTTIHYENNVGIGTTNATEKLTIDGNLKLTRANSGAGLTRELTIEGSRGSSSGVTAFGKLIFNNSDANSGATAYDAVKLEAETTGNNGGELVFFTTPNSSTTAEEAVRITSDGKVGIGTDNPSSILHVSDTNPAVRITDENQAADNRSWNISAGTSNRLRIQAINDSGTGGGSLFDFYRVNSNVTEFRGTKSGNTWFVVNNTNERVGIGSSVPTAKLDVDGTVNVTGVSTFSDDINIGIAGTVAVFDVSGGKLGIGVANPNTKLHVKGTNAPGIRLQDADGTNQYATFIQNNGQFFINSRNDTSRGIIAFRGENGTDVEEFMRISSSGDVGIGTDEPTAKLDVRGTLNISGITTASSFVKSGGSSSEFLKADGSVDSNTYLTAVTVGVGATAWYRDAVGINTTASVGIGTTAKVSSTALLDVNGIINSHNDIRINGTSVLSTAENDAVALAIALG